ncbi:cell death abnormality protein 1-like [Ostrea edulis]|uniref:cell death abnormality protein 1-like n=1 Tax=Ostrea edulis TaxID=37623 RepID=UPI0024AF6400|nr:cell death abnormality protein 1-like [Ostrea edulis]
MWKSSYMYFLYFVICVLLLCTESLNKTNGENCGTDGEFKCCNNYYQAKNTCVECPNGTHGLNCSLNCPENSYGKNCLKACNCKPHETCDSKSGKCSVKPGYCRNGTGNIEYTCCINYFYVNTTCTECPIGTYDSNCSQICSRGYYGKLCVKKCECQPNETCDPKHGCKECPIGTYDSNCSQICSSGYYGKLCVKKCECQPNETCDPKHGCKADPRPHHPQNGDHTVVATLAPVITAFVLFFCIYWVGQYIRRNYRRMKPVAQNVAGGARGTCDKQTTSSVSNHPFDKTGDSLSEHGDDETDEGVYNTLTLRVTGYEEPVKRNQLIRCYSDASSTYTKGFACKYILNN